MKRREFMLAGAAGVLIPALGRASALPCPPGQVSIAGGNSSTTACPSDLSGTGYSTNFATAENPVSEGGHWVQGGVTGRMWQNTASQVGRAYASATSDGYNDCISALATPTIGADQQVTAV